MIFHVSSGKMAFLFPKNMLPLWTENEKSSFSKNTWKYNVFCILGKDAISFSYKQEITPLTKKAKMTFSRKIHLKDGIHGITEKYDTHPRKDDIEILD